MISLKKTLFFGVILNWVRLFNIILFVLHERNTVFLYPLFFAGFFEGVVDVQYLLAQNEDCLVSEYGNKRFLKYCEYPSNDRVCQYYSGQMKTFYTDITNQRPWRPETSIYYELRKNHMACLVGGGREGGFWQGALIDACDNSASLSMVYAVDVLRSVARGDAEDAKYVRITVSPSSAGGAGWHLIDRPWHQHTWFESWTNRVTWFGPVADQYQVTLKGHDTDLELFNSIPVNHARYSLVSGRSIIRIALPVRGAGSLFIPLVAEREEGEPLADVDLNLLRVEPDVVSGESRNELPGSGSVAAEANDESGREFQPAVWTAEKLHELFGSEYKPDLSDISEVSDSDSASSTDFLQESDRTFLRSAYADCLGGKRCSGDSINVRGGDNKVARHLRTALQLMPDFSYTNERSVTYKNFEYEIVNISSYRPEAMAGWIWTRNFDRYGSHWRKQSKDVLYGNNWFFEDQAFSPAAYAHFSPGFSATFKVPASKRDYSVIDFVAGVRPVALAGHVTYGGFYQSFSKWSQEGQWVMVGHRITINWGAAAFGADVPVSIEAAGIASKRGLCLNVREGVVTEGGEVNLYHCRGSGSQVWNVDDEDRYHAQLADNFCLTHDKDGSVSMRLCGQSSHQKWRWEGRRFISHKGFLAVKGKGQLGVVRDVSEATDWYSFVRPSPVTDIIRVEPF